jgi:hypothetical protein
LSAHLDQGLCGYPVSFAYGYEGVVDPDGRISDLRHWNFPKISAGLAFTNAWSSSGGYADPRRHAHSLGRHIKVDVADALVLDTRAPAYFKTVNEHMDTGGRQAFATDLPAVTQRDFAVEEFPWMKDSLDLPAGDDATSEVFDPATATSARARHQRAERKLKQEIRTLKKQLKAASQAGQRRPGPLKRVRGRIARRLRGT